jgi:hypothetical protein
MTIETTRRAVLAGAPAIALVATIPGTLKAAPSALRGEWDAAMASYQRAKAEDEAFTRPYMALHERCTAECDRVPHVTLPPDPYWGALMHGEVSTANRLYVEQARSRVREVEAGRCWLDPAYPELQEHLQHCRDVVKAADERDATVQSILDRYGMDEKDRRSEELTDRLTDAAAFLMGIPAPDLAALRWKIDYLTDDGADWDGWEHHYAAQPLADIVRLLPPAA